MLREMTSIMSWAPRALEVGDWVWSLDPLLNRPQKLAPSQARKGLSVRVWVDPFRGSSGSRGELRCPGTLPGPDVGNGKVGCIKPGGSWYGTPVSQEAPSKQM